MSVASNCVWERRSLFSREMEQEGVTHYATGQRAAALETAPGSTWHGSKDGNWY